VAMAETVASHSFELMAQIFVAMNLGKEIDARKLGKTSIVRIKIPAKAKFNIIKKNKTIHELDMLLEDEEK